MKKVLSLVLVAVLAIGMGMSGFATLGSNTVAKVTGFYQNYSLIDGYKFRTNDNQYTTISNLRTVNLGLIYAQDKIVDYIDLPASHFIGSREVAGVSTYVNKVYSYLDTVKFANSSAVFQVPQGYRTHASWQAVQDLLIECIREPYITSYATAAQLNISSKSDVNTWLNAAAGRTWPSLVVGFDYIIGETYDQAFARLTAANMVRPADLNRSKYDAWYRWYQLNGFVKENVNTSLNNVVWFYNVEGAIWNDQPTTNVLVTERNLSSEEIRENNITVYTQIQEESSAVKEVNFLRGEGRIEIKWATRFVSVDKKDFLLTVALNFNGRRDDDNALTFVGTMYNKELKIYASANSADISEGLIAIPVEFNSKIALYVGNGATIHTKLFKDKKYYCTTTRDPDEADDIVFRQYPDVDNVLTFFPVGVNNTGDYVTLSTDYDAYYIYDRDLNYLGRGNEQLAYSSKYYLANKRLDIATDEEPADYETPAELPPSNPITGGDGQAANNVNSNPGTGR